MIDPVQYEAQMQSGVAQNAKPAEADFSFWDLLDFVNPLQHIPVVNMIYRGVTGDTIKPAAQIAGGAIFGGFFGAASGIVNTIVAQETGRDINQNAIALFTGDNGGGGILKGVQVGASRYENQDNQRTASYNSDTQKNVMQYEIAQAQEERVSSYGRNSFNLNA